MDSKPTSSPRFDGVALQQEAQTHDLGRTSAVTETESALRLHLEQSLRTRFQTNPCKPHCWFYYGFYDFVLREGRFFTPRPRPAESRRGAAEEPFLNSLMNAAAQQLEYVEGYALQGSLSIPVLHAWNSDSQGLVIDTTWDPTGVAYFGVVIPRTLVFATNHEGRIGSSIDNWRQDWPLLRRPWNKTLSELSF